MRSKILRGIVAVSIVASSAMAGTLTSDLDINVSKEWLAKNKLTDADSNVTINLSSFRYKPTDIPAGSLDNPTLNVAVTGVVGLDINSTDDATLGLCEDGGDINKSVLKYDHIDSDNHKIIFKSIDSDRQMGNSKNYFLCMVNEDGNETNATVGGKVVLTANIDEKVGVVKNQYILYSGDSQEINDESKEVQITNQTQQLCAKVAQKADQKIDPATGFVAFDQTSTTTGGCNSSTTTNLTKKDDIIIAFYDTKSKIGNASYEVSNYTAVATIKSDRELPLDTDNTKLSSTNNTNNTKLTINDDKDEFKISEKSVSFTATPSKNDDFNLTLTLAVDGETVLKETKFTADLGFDLNNDGTVEDDFSSNGNDAGAWLYKGTSVNIPYVVANGDTETYIRLTNGASVDSDVYWNCTDDDGLTVTNILVDSADQKHSYVPKNGASVWTTTAILEAAQDVNPDFAPNGKMKCTPLVTSTSGVEGVVIMTINGARDRVIPVTTQVQK